MLNLTSQLHIHVWTNLPIINQNVIIGKKISGAPEEFTFYINHKMSFHFNILLYLQSRQIYLLIFICYGANLQSYVKNV